MTRIVVTHAAPPGTVFEQHAFDSQTGKEVPFQIEGDRTFRSTVIEAVVSADGSTVDITLDVPHLRLPVDGISLKEVDHS